MTMAKARMDYQANRFTPIEELPWQEETMFTGGVIADPAPTSKPCVRLSPHTAPEHTGCCHQRHDEQTNMACLLFRLDGRVLVMLCGFQCVKDACHTCTCAASAGVKPDILPLPKASRTPCPRQRILRLSRRHLLVSTGSTQVLGDLSRFGLRKRFCKRIIPLNTRQHAFRRSIRQDQARFNFQIRANR